MKEIILATLCLLALLLAMGDTPDNTVWLATKAAAAAVLWVVWKLCKRWHIELD